MKEGNRDKILKLLEQQGSIRPAELAESLAISHQALHRHLKKLLDDELLIKKGKPPLVFYELRAKHSSSLNFTIEDEKQNYIEKNFSYLSPGGELLKGLDAFKLWLERTGQLQAADILAETYCSSLKKIQNLKGLNGFFDLTDKLQDTFLDLALKKIYCTDFYSIPQFEKTHLGNLVTAGKSGQNKAAIQAISASIEKKLKILIKDKKIDAIAWAPHSIERKMLFLPELKKQLKLSLPEIKLVKVFSGDIPVAQKSLSKLNDRIENARETIFLKSQFKDFKKILLIDDAIGSGATLNESAKKLSINSTVYGYAVVGSMKGFDVLPVV